MFIPLKEHDMAEITEYENEQIKAANASEKTPVSYTHLTLPTILRV